MILSIEVINVPVVAATLVAFIIGALVSYGLNTRWTFEASLTPRNFVRFLVVTLIGLGLSMLIAWALNVIGIHYLLISLLIIILIPVWNFIAHGAWTYR